MTRLFLASWTARPYLLAEAKPPYVLDSFHYFKKVSGKSERTIMNYVLSDDCKMFLLDSGAFTYMAEIKNSGSVKINFDRYVEEYATFINKYDIQYFFELDIDSVVGLETQGSIWRDWFLKIDDLTISPKPPSSLMKTDFNVLDDIVSKLLTHKVNFSLKIVYFNEKDKEYAKEVFNRFRDNNIPYYLSVGNESPYTDKDITKQLLNKLDELWNVVINEPEFNDVQALPQLHSIVWGNKRGV
ncbi:hypothetical protein M2L77_000509 [Staphylococcus pseudintermedius]|nr:hypothetical protein [Staphylococcus pseudintermedius]